MDRHRPLIRSFGVDLDRGFRLIRVVTGPSAFGYPTGDSGHALGATEGLNIFVEDLIHGWSSGNAARGKDRVIGVVHRDTVLDREARLNLGGSVAAMAGVAG